MSNYTSYIIDNEEAMKTIRAFREAMDSPETAHREILLGSLDLAIHALGNYPCSKIIFLKDEL